MKKPKTLKVIRQSQLPIDDKDKIAHKAEFKALYDVAEKEAGKEMLVLQQKLLEIDKHLDAKYPCEAQWKWLTQKELVKKIEEFNAPIMVAKMVNSEEVMYVIMDELAEGH